MTTTNKSRLFFKINNENHIYIVYSLFPYKFDIILKHEKHEIIVISQITKD